MNIAPGDESVRLTLPGRQVLEVHSVVAADGAGSAIRHQLEVETDGPGDIGHFLNVMFRADYGPRLEGGRAILYPTFTDDNLEFFVAIDGTDLWLMHHFLQPGETAADFPSGRLQPIVVKASGLPNVPVQILSVNDYRPAARPGSRAPHLLIERQRTRLSILDLFGDRFVLLLGSDCQFAKADISWLDVLQNRRDFVAGSFEKIYGMTGAGAVLVRPDGYVGARWERFDGGSK